jgi:hypothetical protein
MKLERFQELLDILNGDLSFWPEADREAAKRLLVDDPRARAALQQAQVFDRLIRRGLAVKRISESAANEAAERVLARLAAAPLPRRRGGGLTWARGLVDWMTLDFAAGLQAPRLTALACAGVLGIAIGMLAPELFASPEPGRYAVSNDGDSGAFVFDGEQDTGAVL